MNKTAILAGAAVVLLVAGAVVWLQWGQHIELQGRILDARVHGTTDSDCIVVVDAELINPADVDFEVENTGALLTSAQGEPFTGDPVATVDAERVMEAFPLLKGSTNMPLLRLHDVLKPRQTIRKRLTFQFAGLAAAQFAARKSLVVKIQDRLGTVAELK